MDLHYRPQFDGKPKTPRDGGCSIPLLDSTRPHSLPQDELPWPIGDLNAQTEPALESFVGTDLEVAIVDDDGAMCDALSHVLVSVGYRVTTFGSAAEFLDHVQSRQPTCALIDLMLPGASGLMLCQRLKAIANLTMTFAMISGHVEVSTAVEAMKLGAIDVLVKPCGRQRVCDVVARAAAKSRYLRKRVAELQNAKDKIAKLTLREHQILIAMSEGQITKEIARHLGISARTVDVHRSRIMEKLEIGSPTQLGQVISILHGEHQEWRFDQG